MAYVHLHGYSTYSFLEGIGSPKIIAQTAKDLWQNAIALTDMGVMYGAILHFKAGKELDINAIIGVELGFVLDIQSAKNKEIWTMTLLSKDFEGYQNLLNLTTFAGQQGVEKFPKIDLATLKRFNTQLIALIWGTHSRIATMLNSGESLDKVKEILLLVRDAVGAENCYLEITIQDEKTHPQIAKINQTLLQLSEELNIPCILTNHYFYPKKEDKPTQELAMAIKDNLRLYDPNHRKYDTLNHIMSEEEIRSIASKNGYSTEQIDTRCQNTVKIADQCHTKIAMGQMLFPKYEGEEDVVALYEKYKDKLVEETA